MTMPEDNSPAVTESEIRVRFGPNPTQTMPIEWAEDLLSKFRDQYPSPFVKLMGEVVLQGHESSGKRLRNRESDR